MTLLIWLFRRRFRSRRAWVCLVLWLGWPFGSAPCYRYANFPAQDFGNEPAEERWSLAELSSIQRAETEYYSQFHRYGGLVEIQAQDITYSHPHPYSSSGNITLVLTPNGYQIISTPDRHENWYACCIGCPGYRSFYTDETGVLRAGTHCRNATANSPIVK